MGDRVRSKFYNIVGTVIDVDADGYIINPDHLEEMWIGEDDAEAYDRKADFLTRLSELMREFDAQIYGGQDEQSWEDFITIAIGDDEVTYRNGSADKYASIKPDKIMDYDKD